MEKRDRTLASKAREFLLTAALIVLCFVIFLGLVHFSFPEGMSLRGLIQPGEAPSLRVEFDGVDVDGRRAELATLKRVVRKVKDKPADDIAWHEARPGMSLGTRHSIQTHDRSSATIAFGEDNELVLGENSLIVLRSYEGDEGSSDRRATLVVFGGELRGSIGSKAGGLALAVQTPTGEARLAKDEKGGSSFRVSVGQDSSSTIVVYEGSAEIRSGDRLVEVQPNQSVQVDPEGHVSSPAPVPTPPKLQEPADGQRFPFRSTPPDVEFRWGRSDHADSYRFVIARDKSLETIVQERVAPGQDARVGTLEPGSYYWNVIGLHAGVPGSPSRSLRFHLVRDDEPPPLDVHWPEGAVTEKSVRLTGVTESGAHVFVSSRRATVDSSGKFEIDVTLSRGANNVVVEAVDDVGNSTYSTRMIKALY